MPPSDTPSHKRLRACVRCAATLVVCVLLARVAPARRAVPTRAAQTIARQAPAFADHKRVVRSERDEAFRAAWAQADEAARGRATEFLVQRRRSGAPLGTPPSLDVLSAATRVLGGASVEAATSELAQLADALDLLVTPGAFPARLVGEASTKRGDPLTVRVYRLYGAEARDAEVRLYWRSSTGEETLARSSNAAAAAFGQQGFELYVFAPFADSMEAATTWELVLELEVDGQVERAPHVIVEGVPWLEEQLASVASTPLLDEDSPVGVGLAEIRLLLERGMRFGRGPRLAESLRGLGTFKREVAVPIDLRSSRPRSSEVQGPAWALSGAGEGPLVIFVAPSHEPVDAIFAPHSLASLRAALPEPTLASVAYERRSGGDFARLLDAVKRAHPHESTVLVLRGDALTRVAFGLLAGLELDVDGLVFVTEAPQPIGGVPQVPLLFLSSGGAASAQPNAGKQVTRVALEAPLYTAELGLGAHLASWLKANAEALR